MPESIDVVTPPPITVEIQEPSVTSVEVTTAGGVQVELSNGASTVNLVVTDADPESVQLLGTGLIVQTGLGPSGDDWTLWIEDGK